MKSIFLLFFIPGLCYLAAFLLFYLVLFLWHRRFQTRQIPLSLIIVGVIFALVHLVTELHPYLVLTLLLIAGLGYFSLKRGKRLQVLSLPLSILIFIGCYQLVTFVPHLATVTATWKIGERGKKEAGNPEEILVEFKYGAQNNHIISTYSDELATYLRDKQSVPITLELLYHWGRLAGLSLKQVDGKSFRMQGGYSGCAPKCENRPYPRYYFGLWHH